MHKKASKGHFSSKNKEKAYQLPKVNILNFDDELSPLPNSKRSTKKKETNNFLPSINNHNDSSTWSRQDSENSASYSKDIEELSTQKVIDQWKIVEDILYNKRDQSDSNGILYEECLQWQNQLPHLRIIGKSYQELNGETKEEVKVEESEDEDEVKLELYSENSERRRSSQFSIPEATKITAQNRGQIREYVFDNLIEYICSELMYYQQELEESMNNEFDEYLNLNSFDNITEGAELLNGKLMSEKNNSEDYISLEDDKKHKQKTPSANDDEERSQTEHSNTGRPKPGTVFGEKIIVSPVPCPISTRESFTTMKINPVQLVGRPVDFFTSRGHSSRNYYYSSTRQTSVTPSQSGWRNSDHFASSSHNVKLAPMELPALPNNKKRSAIIANNHQLSLSPINLSESLNNKKSEKSPNGSIKSDYFELLEIQGTRITTNNKPKRIQERLKK